MSPGWDRRRVLLEFGRWQTDQTEQAQRLDAEALDYVDYHAARYARLLEAVDEALARTRPGDGWRLLDVGPNIQTALLRSAHPQAIVDTLGFANPAVPPGEHERHLEFDLNLTPERSRWPMLERQYDVIVLAEVLEHLHVPALTVLEFLGGQLRDPGYIIIQTPNGAALHKRVALAMGRNPVEPPRVCQDNPGHFHEYTVRELRDQVKAGGLTIEWLRTENYFGSGRAASLYRAAGTVMPMTWRHGVTLCARAGD